MGEFGRQYKALDFFDPQEAWETNDDGESNFLRRINKDGEEGWQFHAMVDVDDRGGCVVVLRREEEDRR
jgi:hypothetical protein